MKTMSTAQRVSPRVVFWVFLAALFTSLAYSYYIQTAPSTVPFRVPQIKAQEPVPVNKPTGSPHPFCPHRRARSFQKVTYPVSVPPTLDFKKEDITSGVFTTYEIAHRRPVYRVCDEIELRIDARNGRGVLKDYGGDYFRVKAQTINATFTASTSSDGEVWDHGNGTYSAYVTLKWAGHVTITVILVHASEAVYLLDKLPENIIGRFNYTGLFMAANNSKISEERECNYVPLANEDMICNLTHREVTWYCMKPTNPELSCSDWTMHRRPQKIMYRDIMRPLRKRDLTLFNSLSDITINGTDRQITVFPQELDDSIDATVAQLPPCHLRSFLQQPRFSGYYINGRWVSPYCKVGAFQTVESVRECMANTSLGFYGDSTIRQVMYHLVDNLRVVARAKPCGVPCASLDGLDATGRKAAHFEFHDLPVHLTDWLNVSKIQPVSSYLDSIGDNVSVVITVCMMAHMTHTPLSFYRQRIQTVIDAAERLHARNPRSLVILKGGSTREHENAVRYLVSSDWRARRLTETITDLLENHPNIGFLDSWDMTYAQIAPDTIHPQKPFVQNFLRTLLSIVCPAHS